MEMAYVKFRREHEHYFVEIIQPTCIIYTNAVIYKKKKNADIKNGWERPLTKGNNEYKSGRK